jgi:NADH dehydrogenase FAD-containing subunit
MTRTLILGAGFGGLTVATELRGLVGPEHEIVLMDRRPSGRLSDSAVSKKGVDRAGR